VKTLNTLVTSLMPSYSDLLLFLVLPNDSAPPLLQLLLCALDGIVNLSQLSNSTWLHPPRRAVHSSSRSYEIIVLLLSSSSSIA